MASQFQTDANRRNAQKSTGPRTQEGKATCCRGGLQYAKSCMFPDEDPEALLDLIEEIREKFNPRDTDEDFLIERMAKARFKYNRIMPIEAAISNLRPSAGQVPGKLASYEASLLHEYDRSRQKLEKLQKIRTATAAPANYELKPISRARHLFRT